MMDKDLGLGVVFVVDYGYGRITSRAEFERVVSLHRRFLRKRFWTKVMIALAALVIGVIITFSLVRSQQTATEPTVPSQVEAQTTETQTYITYLPFVEHDENRPAQDFSYLYPPPAP